MGPRIGLRSWPASLAAIALADEERIDVSREIPFPWWMKGTIGQSRRLRRQVVSRDNLAGEL